MGCCHAYGNMQTCCCCSVRHGVFIIATINILAGIPEAVEGAWIPTIIRFTYGMLGFIGAVIESAPIVFSFWIIYLLGMLTTVSVFVGEVTEVHLLLRDADADAESYAAALYVIISIFVISFIIDFWFTSIVYSFYKRLTERNSDKQKLEVDVESQQNRINHQTQPQQTVYVIHSAPPTYPQYAPRQPPQ